MHGLEQVEQIALLSDDFTFVACRSDTGLLARGADKSLEDVKRGMS